MKRPGEKHGTERTWVKPASRLALIGLAVMPFCILEFTLRVSGYGEPSEAEVPEIGASGTHALFELDEAGTRYRLSPARRDFFRPASFAVRKDPTAFRIFCLGGSTVQGRPYSTETAFPQWLALSLAAADPGRPWEVVNCGGISYASHRLLPIMRELVAYEPDLFIIYTGHNEFLEERTLWRAEDPASASGWLRRLGSRLHTVNLVRRAWRARRRDGEPASEEVASDWNEVFTRLDEEDGWEAYHRDEAWVAEITRDFGRNLRSMLETAARAGVPVFLVDPVSNLKECPPFKVEPGPLTADARRRFDDLYRQAASPDLDAPHREQVLTAAVALDALHAGAHYRLGQCRLFQGDRVGARASFIRSKDTDVCPLRTTEAIHEVLRRSAATGGVTWIEGRRMFEQLAADGIPGNDVLVDHVHPTIHGHQQLARLLFDHLEQQGVVTAGAGWEAGRTASYLEHLRTLEPTYYVRAQQRLDRVNRWCRGLEQKPGAIARPSSGD